MIKLRSWPRCRKNKYNNEENKIKKERVLRPSRSLLQWPLCYYMRSYLSHCAIRRDDDVDDDVDSDNDDNDDDDTCKFLPRDSKQLCNKSDIEDDVSKELFCHLLLT